MTVPQTVPAESMKLETGDLVLFVRNPVKGKYKVELWIAENETDLTLYHVKDGLTAEEAVELVRNETKFTLDCDG